MGDEKEHDRNNYVVEFYHDEDDNGKNSNRDRKARAGRRLWPTPKSRRGMMGKPREVNVEECRGQTDF